MKDYNFKSTITSIKSYMSSFEKQDEEHEINEMIDEAVRGMESVDDVHEMCRFQGRIQGLRTALAVPRNILEVLTEEAEREPEPED